MCTHVCAYVWLHMRIYVHMCVVTHESVCMYQCEYCVAAYLSLSTCVVAYLNVYMCVHVCGYTCEGVYVLIAHVRVCTHV